MASEIAYKRKGKLLWFAHAFAPCRDCGRPTRARHYRICRHCLRARWQAGENFPFGNEWTPEADTEKPTNEPAETK
jgi:ribosomal protein S14